MLDSTTSRNFLAPSCQGDKIQNPNIEIRNKPTDLNPNNEIRNEFVWKFLIFLRLRLFRISDFEFRICFYMVSLAFPFHAAQGMLCANYLFSGLVIQYSTEKLKYVWLGLGQRYFDEIFLFLRPGEGADLLYHSVVNRNNDLRGGGKRRFAEGTCEGFVFRGKIGLVVGM